MTSYLFIEYPKCSTCQKAKKWLEDNHVSFIERHIVENRPTAEELREWHARSNMPLKSFFNTSGLKYKALELKDKLPGLNENEQLEILASDGMLVKRPLLIGGNIILSGFKPELWKQLLL